MGQFGSAIHTINQEIHGCKVSLVTDPRRTLWEAGQHNDMNALCSNAQCNAGNCLAFEDPCGENREGEGGESKSNRGTGQPANVSLRLVKYSHGRPFNTTMMTKLADLEIWSQFLSSLPRSSSSHILPFYSLNSANDSLPATSLIYLSNSLHISGFFYPAERSNLKLVSSQCYYSPIASADRPETRLQLPFIRYHLFPMPVPVTSTTAKSSSSTATKSRGQIHGKKTRSGRRRGRATGGFESDEEIVREIATDSDTDDDSSSLDSASDSDTEPASEDVITNERHSSTPDTSQDTSLTKDVLADVSGAHGAFFTTPGNWSEMVADETAHGPADLPVIDFADFDAHAVQPKTIRPRKPKAAKQAPPKPEPQPPHRADDEEQPSSSQLPPRTVGQTARQAYQKRLENDPSFVPKVGEFWGHDDRLLDKDLRSLSGWWRGRWQGRGRGFAPRGRGGFHTTRPQPGGQTADDNPDAPLSAPVEVAPIEKSWTHDGYEEMRRREEQRQHKTTPVRGGFGNSRGSFVPSRGRGRGGFAASPSARPRNTSTFTPPPGRPWFVMKPERPFTKQQEGFLYLDPALKPRHNQGFGIRVKLPGSHGLVIRTPLNSTSSTAAKPARVAPPVSANGSEYDAKHLVVRLPARPAQVATAFQPSALSLAEPHDDDIASNIASASVAPAEASQEPEIAVQPPEATGGSSSDSAGWIQPSEINLDDNGIPSQPDRLDQRPPLHPLQTTFTPPVASPPYGSPYAYAHTLPHGVALNQHGMAYELATGRPVYFQTPMPPMYDPRPVMHPTMPPFVPGHVHHHSMDSPDPTNPQSLSHPQHPPPINNFIDPATGAPIFSLPRQTRIEIRAPTEQDEGRASSSKLTRRVSGLRGAAATFEPSRPLPMSPSYGQETGFAPSVNDSANGDVAPHPSMDPNMMGYSTYSQQYYYPNYMYPQYMDMTQIPPYEYYPSDPRLQGTGTVYY